MQSSCFKKIALVVEGNGNPLQCSFLENPRDGGTCWAAVYGVAQSRTRLKQLNSSSRRKNMILMRTTIKDQGEPTMGDRAPVW